MDVHWANAPTRSSADTYFSWMSAESALTVRYLFKGVCIWWVLRIFVLYSFCTHIWYTGCNSLACFLRNQIPIVLLYKTSSCRKIEDKDNIKTQYNAYSMNTHRPPSQRNYNCNQKCSFLGLLELFPPCVLRKSRSIMIYLEKCILYIFVENLVCFEHLHYFRLTKMLPIERHCNSLFKEVLQAYV